jgi:hypothetical protein
MLLSTELILSRLRAQAKPLDFEPILYDSLKSIMTGAARKPRVRIPT